MIVSDKMMILVGKVEVEVEVASVMANVDPKGLPIPTYHDSNFEV